MKGIHVIDLTWTGTAGSYDIYRNGNLIASGVTSLNYTDDTGLKGAATYLYQVCEAGSTVNCSNIAEVNF